MHFNGPLCTGEIKVHFFVTEKNHTDIIRNTDLRTAMELVQEFEEGMQAEMNCSYSFLNIMSRDYIMVNEYFVKNRQQRISCEKESSLAGIHFMR